MRLREAKAGGHVVYVQYKEEGAQNWPLRDARSYIQGRGESFVDLYALGTKTGLTYAVSLKLV